MLRDELSQALKTAMKARTPRATSTLRLILAAIKDRDIAARSDGNADGITDEAAMAVLQTMIKQRNESIKMYQQGGRPELADQEAEEIEIIKGFLPAQLPDAEIEAAVDATIVATGATGLKDMGRAMAALREAYAGQMDFGKASGFLKQKLAAG